VIPAPAAAQPPAPQPFEIPNPFQQAPPPFEPPVPAQPLEGPAKARSLVRKARQQIQMDRTVEAIRTLEQAVQLEPDSDVAYEAWLLLGQLRLSNPAWSTRAIDALQKASRLRPRAAEPWALMGELYHRKGFAPNAASCYNKALQLDPMIVVPPDVDLDATESAPAQAPKPKGVLGRLGSLLGRSKKS
jgi:cytochrome c-type biogenesis protein CcmH/NrfG